MRRRARIRARIRGTGDRPRLAVFRGLRHISAQLIDDAKGHTLLAATDAEAGNAGKTGKERAAAVGALIGKKAVEKKITRAVFDRRGYKYHGQVQALAEAARKAGLAL